MTTTPTQFSPTASSVIPPGILFNNFTASASVDSIMKNMVINNDNNLGAGISSNRLSSAAGVAVDSSNNIYFCDKGNNRVCKLTPAGDLSIVAGSGSATSSAGTGIAAGVGGPKAMAWDGTNLFVTTTDNKVLKIVASTGVVTVLAGSGTAAETDGTGAAAAFKTPDGIVLFNSNADLYVADQGGGAIRKIVISSGVVTTLAGDSVGGADTVGTGAAAIFNGPTGLATDATNLFVTTQGHRVMKVVVSSGVVTFLVGSGTAGDVDGTGTAASFDTPKGIAYESPNLYVVTGGVGSVRQVVASSGVVTTLAGSVKTEDVDGYGREADFYQPLSVTVHAASGNLVIGSYYKLRGMDLTNKTVNTIMGTTQVGIGFGKVSHNRDIVVTVYKLPTGGALTDKDVFGTFTLAPGAQEILANLDVHFATSDKAYVKASAPGASVRMSGDAIT